MRPFRSLVGSLTLASLGWLLVTPVPAVAVKNNLNLIPPRGVKFGIVRRGGDTIYVYLERVRSLSSQLGNNSSLTISYVAPGGGLYVFDKSPPTPFDEYFPNGAYAFQDPLHDLFAARGCVQASGAQGGWDNGLAYCDFTDTTDIKVKTGPGDWDTVDINPAVVIPVAIVCGPQQNLCGTYCFSDAYTCCDTETGCFASEGFTCAETCPP